MEALKQNKTKKASLGYSALKYELWTPAHKKVGMNSERIQQILKDSL